MTLTLVLIQPEFTGARVDQVAGHCPSTLFTTRVCGAIRSSLRKALCRERAGGCLRALPVDRHGGLRGTRLSGGTSRGCLTLASRCEDRRARTRRVQFSSPLSYRPPHGGAAMAEAHSSRTPRTRHARDAGGRARRLERDWWPGVRGRGADRVHTLHEHVRRVV